MFLKRFRKSSFKKRWKDEEKPTTNDDVYRDDDTDVADLCVCNKPIEVGDEEEEHS